MSLPWEFELSRDSVMECSSTPFSLRILTLRKRTSVLRAHRSRVWTTTRSNWPVEASLRSSRKTGRLLTESDAVLFDEVGDDVCLPAVDPAGEGGSGLGARTGFSVGTVQASRWNRWTRTPSLPTARLDSLDGSLGIRPFFLTAHPLQRTKCSKGTWIAYQTQALHRFASCLQVSFLERLEQDPEAARVGYPRQRRDQSTATLRVVGGVQSVRESRNRALVGDAGESPEDRVPVYAAKRVFQVEIA